MNEDPAKRAWQSSVEIAGALSLQEVRRGANRMYRFVWWRNTVEYAACAVTVVVFGSYVFTLPHVLQKIGSAMIIVATFYVGWQLHLRASAAGPPEKAGTMPLYAFLRTQLVRQRDALRGMFWWYILPFLPGLAVLLVGTAQVKPLTNPWTGWLFVLGFAALVGGILWLNRRFIRNLQRHIDEIDVLTGGIE